MKKIFLLFSLAISSFSFGQITLTSSINPVPGETQKNVDADTTGVSQGPSGANQTWNFTNLTRTDSSVLSWVASGSTPYAAQFPTSNVASSIDNSNFQYFTTSANNLIVNGYAGANQVIPYSDPQTFLQYPFSYGTTFNDNFFATYSLSGFNVTRSGNTTVTGDAWGTINLPFGSFNNALRVKYTVVTRDSSNPGIPFITNSTVTSYTWFVSGKKFPVFEIIYTTIDINGMSSTSSKHVNYSPNNPPIGIANIGTSVPDVFSLKQNYPNPFNPSTKIDFDVPTSGFVNLTVYDELGREVETLVNQDLQSGSYRVDWSGAKYSSGMYFYRIEAGNFRQTRKMTLIK